MRLAVLFAVSACWTGNEPATTPTPPDPPADAARPRHAFEIQLERTPCFGMCPTYKLAISAAGIVSWLGHDNVAVKGPRQRKLTRGQLDRIDRAIDAANFFDLDSYGHRPAQAECVQNGTTTSCSMTAFTMCSDTPHTILSIRRDKGEENQVDDAHCSDEEAELAKLEKLIEEIAVPRDWIGR